MRADHRDDYAIVIGGVTKYARRGRQREIRGAEIYAAQAMHPVRKLAKQRLTECRRYQRDSGGQAIAAHAGRNGNRREIEQVDEIGIEAKVGIEPDRIGFDLRNRIDGGGGWHDHHVDLAELRRRILFQLLQAVRRLECIDGGVIVATRDDFAGDGMHVIAMSRVKVADARESLGDPRAFV